MTECHLAHSCCAVRSHPGRAIRRSNAELIYPLSARPRRWVLLSVIARYRDLKIPKFFWGDAAFVAPIAVCSDFAAFHWTRECGLGAMGVSDI
jgi:hypothetical protein